MQNQKKAASHKKKATASIEQITKFNQHFQKRKKCIEEKYEKSVMNQLYIFPRNHAKMDTSTELSSDSDEQLSSPYNLKMQNQVSRKNQTHNQMAIKKQTNSRKKSVKNEGSLQKGFNKSRKSGINNATTLIDEYHSTKSVKSVNSVESVGKTLKSKKSKGKARNIQITFDTKKKSPNRKKVTSQAKLLIQQYSLDNRAYQSLKRSSKGLIISYRPTKNHQINLSLSSKKVKTLHH